MQDQVTLEFVAENLNLWRANKPTSYSPDFSICSALLKPPKSN